MTDFNKTYTPEKLNDQELLDIFPEGKKIILKKITEYRKQRKTIIKNMQAFHCAVKRIASTEKKDEFFVWFWGFAYLKYFHAPNIATIDSHLYRLHQQKRLFTKSSKKPSEFSWEELKQRAKEQTLSDIAMPILERGRQVGNRITALCPFHQEKTPSFVIYENKNNFHCYGCGAHGDVITFKMRIDNLDFKEAVKELADI